MVFNKGFRGRCLLTPLNTGFRIGCRGKGDCEGSMGGWESLETKFGRRDQGWAITLINQI